MVVEEGRHNRGGALSIPELAAVLSVDPQVSERVVNVVTRRVVLWCMQRERGIVSHEPASHIQSHVEVGNPGQQALDREVPTQIRSICPSGMGMDLDGMRIIRGDVQCQRNGFYFLGFLERINNAPLEVARTPAALDRIAKPPQFSDRYITVQISTDMSDGFASLIDRIGGLGEGRIGVGKIQVLSVVEAYK